MKKKSKTQIINVTSDMAKKKQVETKQLHDEIEAVMKKHSVDSWALFFRNQFGGGHVADAGVLLWTQIGVVSRQIMDHYFKADIKYFEENRSPKDNEKHWMDM